MYGRIRAARRRQPSDSGHEAVGQALLVSIGVLGMLAAARLAEAAAAGMGTVLEALR